MAVEFGRGISEVLVTTSGERPNAAPMGIISRDSLFIAMYKDTHTFSNVKQNGKLVANLVLNPLLYVKAAFDDLEPSYFYYDNQAPILREAHAWVEFSCSVFERLSQTSAIVTLCPLRSVIVERPIVPINRGFNAIIEATIQASRYIALGERSYLELIDHYERVAKKCGGQQELEAFRLLRGYLARAPAGRV